jgi:hypothetical protein
MSADDLRFRSDKLRQVYAYWKEKRRDRPMPVRRDIDPLDLRAALGDIALVEVMRDPLRYRFRLDGTRQVERFGVDMTGKTLDELPDSTMRAITERSYREVVTAGRPAVHQRDVMTDGRLFVYEVVILPLGADGGRVDMLLVCMDFDAPR